MASLRTKVATSAELEVLARQVAQDAAWDSGRGKWVQQFPFSNCTLTLVMDPVTDCDGRRTEAQRDEATA